MELLDIFRVLLVVILSVNLLPTSIPMAALAYKMHRGAQPLDLEVSELWIYSVLFALGLGLFSLVLLGVNFFLVIYGLPPGVVHLACVMLFVPVAMRFALWIFALEEPFEGINVWLIYTGLPGVIIAVLMVFDVRLPVQLAESWLLNSPNQ